MATTIGHASTDENGKLKGGKAGDQTGREVYIRTWYNRPWNVILRPKDSTVAKRLVTAMKAACANNNIGYDQNQRNTALVQARKYNYDLSKIKTKCETDCSALVSLCCMYAGIPESVLYKNGNSCTTSTLRKALIGTGKFTALTDSKYLTSSDYLKVGDILLYEGHHTAINLTDGAKVKTTAPTSSVYTKTQFIKDVQKAIGTTADGIVGTKTLNALVTVSASKNSKHACVKALQKYLNQLGYSCGTADGVFGSNTTKGVKAYQKAKKLTQDGIVGKNTWKSLFGVK